MFRASSAHLQEDTVVLHAAYGTVTVYESSWWLVDTQLEWGLTQAVYLIESDSTISYAACVQLYPPEDEHLNLETCRGD